MKIGFDISQTAESKAGCGFFADQLIRAIAQVDNLNEYTLYPIFYDYRPLNTEHATHVEKKNFKNSSKDAPDFLKGCSDELDIIHSNNFRFPYGTMAKKIVTIYDICFFEYPEYTTEANRLFCYQGTFDAMLQADKIIAISQYTKKRLLHFFPNTDEKKIEVVYCGNRSTLLLEQKNQGILDKYDLKENDYFLSVGTIEPRKNYHALLSAFAEYRKKAKHYKKLCIAGGYGWLEENFKEKIADLGLVDDVVVTGYVSDEELANLYRYCYTFIYPSWYEGFGLPVLEAMNFGKPVIASNVTSIPEITGKSAILINPHQPDEITVGMWRLEDDLALFNKLADEGKERASLFSWDKAAKETIKIYQDLLLK